MTVQNPPEGFASVNAYLTVDDAAAAIDYYVRAFGAEELMRSQMGGRVGHAEIRLGSSIFMLSDEFPEMDYLGPKARGGSSVAFMLYVDDVDAVFAQAIAAGGTEARAVEDQFYGDRSGTLVDPFGHRWLISTHVEDVDGAEIERRMKAMGIG